MRGTAKNLIAKDLSNEYRRVESTLSPIQSADSEATENESLEDTRESMSECSEYSIESRRERTNQFSHFELLMRSKKGRKGGTKNTRKSDKMLKKKITDHGKLSYLDRLMKKRDESIHDESVDIEDERHYDHSSESIQTKSTKTPDSKGKPACFRRLAPVKKGNRAEYFSTDDKRHDDGSDFEDRDALNISAGNRSPFERGMRRDKFEDIERDRTEVLNNATKHEADNVDRKQSNYLSKILRSKKKGPVANDNELRSKKKGPIANDNEFVYKSIEGDGLSFGAGTFSVHYDEISSEESESNSIDESVEGYIRDKRTRRQQKERRIEKCSDGSMDEDELSFDEEGVSVYEDERSVYNGRSEFTRAGRKRSNIVSKFLRRKRKNREKQPFVEEYVGEDEQSFDDGSESISMDEDELSTDDTLSRSLSEDDETNKDQSSRTLNPSLDATISREKDGSETKMIVLKPNDPMLQRKVVKKEVTVKSIGNATRSQYVVKGKPSIPYQLSSIRPLLVNTEPAGRMRTTPRYHVQSPRNGSVFQRIKPRPVLTDVTHSKSLLRKTETNEISSRPIASPSDNINNNSLQYRPKSRALESLRSRRSRSKSKTQSRGFWIKNEAGVEEGEEHVTNYTAVRRDDDSSEMMDFFDAAQGSAGTEGDSMDVQLEADYVDVFGDENVPKNGNGTSEKKVRVLSKAWRRTREERPEIDEREYIDNVEVAYNEPESPALGTNLPVRLLGRNTKKKRIQNVQDHVSVIVEKDKIDQDEARQSQRQFEEMPKATKGIFKGRIKSFHEKYLKAKVPFELEKKHSSDPKRPTQYDFVRAMETELILDSYGLLENTKIVYREIGGDSSDMMTVVQEYENLVPAPDSSNALIQIEASTVSKMDANIRHGHLCIPNGGDLPITPGIDFVGRVRRCGEIASIRYGINEHDRVASLCGYGGNAKYIAMESSRLVRVPVSVPATSATIVAESYLPAFQALHTGIDDLEERHSPCSMKDKSVLIFGGISSVGQAMIELAFLFGADKVYSTGLVKHHDLLESLGATPLGIDPKDWLPSIREEMDIVIDPYSTKPTDQLRQTIKTGGKIVRFGCEKDENEPAGCFYNLFANSDEAVHEFNYDIFDEWENNLETSKSDLSYLFGLLKTDKIEPQVARTLKLHKVPDAHFYLDGRRRVQGTFVCIPWAERQT